LVAKSIYVVPAANMNFRIEEDMSISATFRFRRRSDVLVIAHMGDAGSLDEGALPWCEGVEHMGVLRIISIMGTGGIRRNLPLSAAVPREDCILIFNATDDVNSIVIVLQRFCG
jgi:hypothetical protein